MKWPSPYLKMRVLGAVENAEGNTIRERIKNTAKLSFTDEEGFTRTFTCGPSLPGTTATKTMVLPV